MEEVKFRAWHKYQKRMFDVGAISFELKKVFQKDGIVWRFKEVELMRFTGLHCEDGREIWEGDKVVWLGHEVRAGIQIRPLRNLAVGKATSVGRNSFIDDCYYLQNLIEQGDNHVEVVGNVYEHAARLQENSSAMADEG